MQMTLLEIVQRVLNAMNHDIVESVTDTVESQQIAEEAKVLYYDMMDRQDWPHLRKVRFLEGLDDTDTPTHVRIPDEVVRIENLRFQEQEVSPA